MEKAKTVWFERKCRKEKAKTVWLERINVEMKRLKLCGVKGNVQKGKGLNCVV